MKIRIQEIELGAQDPDKSKNFYASVLGLDTVIDQDQLAGLDFNVSAHLPAKIMVISFLTDDWRTVIDKLQINGISFTGPKKSHLGMQTIEFTDPDGYLIRVNRPTTESPSWLTV